MLNTRSGLNKDREAADLSYQRKVMDQEKEWVDLAKKFDEAKRRYKLILAIEHIQKEKSEYERDRLNRGRTTSIQVLTFEQDFRTSQLNRIQSQAEILNLVAQMKTFGGSRL